MESINFSTFVNKGVYKALTDEAKCESASGADAASEAASATAHQLVVVELEQEILLTLLNIPLAFIQGKLLEISTRKGWVDIELVMGQTIRSSNNCLFIYNRNCR